MHEKHWNRKYAPKGTTHFVPRGTLSPYLKLEDGVVFFWKQWDVPYWEAYRDQRLGKQHLSMGFAVGISNNSPWKRHRGSKRPPVPLGTQVEVRCRDGRLSSFTVTDFDIPAQTWQHLKSFGDVMAYRLL